MGRAWHDYLAVAGCGFSLVGWLQFVLGLALEGNNAARLQDRGWGNADEHTQWFMFAVLGLLAVLCLLGYSFRKSKALLKSGLLLSLISLVAVGGPLDDSGRFLWNCMQKDPTTGSRYEPQGCQEETYDNYALIFTGSFTFALFHTLATYFATMAPMHSRFTFKDDDSLSDRFEPNTAQ